jgi:hypothetical protein
MRYLHGFHNFSAKTLFIFRFPTGFHSRKPFTQPRVRCERTPRNARSLQCSLHDRVTILAARGRCFAQLSAKLPALQSQRQPSPAERRWAYRSLCTWQPSPRIGLGKRAATGDGCAAVSSRRKLSSGGYRYPDRSPFCVGVATLSLCN